MGGINMEKVNPFVSAAALMVLAMTLIPMGDASGKLLVAHYGIAPFFVAWTRFAVGGVLVLPFVFRSGKSQRFQMSLLWNWRIILRASLIVGGICSILTALRTISLANTFGAFFIGPIVAYFLAGWLLKERISIPRSALLLVGFGGVLLVVKPGFGMEAGTGFAILAGVFYGCFIVTNRWLASLSTPTNLLFSQLVIGALLLLPFGTNIIPEISWNVAGLVLASAAFSLLGNLFLIVAGSKIATTRLAPLIYFQLIAATGMGYVIFNDVPDLLSFLGLVILLVSGFAGLFFTER